jgi:hypothetical protein
MEAKISDLRSKYENLEISHTELASAYETLHNILSRISHQIQYEDGNGRINIGEAIRRAMVSMYVRREGR